MWEWHNYLWENPHMGFICLLKALSVEINIDPHELTDAKWMKIVRNNWVKLDANELKG